jgi:lipopolysaccharide biosynthesis glycosyltransferase
MLLDLALWRQQGIEGQTTAFLEQYGNQLNGADQDVLNGVLMNRWHSLPGYWNDQEAANRKPRHGASEKNIRHFSGPQKPWDSGLFDPDCRQWLSIASETGFHSPLEFALWRSRRFCTVLRGTGSNWLRTKGWMR